jgi:hypothetical protein
MNKLLIGWASRDVSTDKPVNIPGQFHMRISQGILDPVTLTTLVLDNGDDCVIFMSLDLVVICDGLLDQVRYKVKTLNPKIPVLKILLNATHTHAGPSHYASKASAWASGCQTTQVAGVARAGVKPVSNETLPEAPPQDWFAGVPHDGVEIASSDEYREFLSTQAAEAICEAYQKRAPGGLSYGYGYAVVGHSRRVVYLQRTEPHA